MTRTAALKWLLGLLLLTFLITVWPTAYRYHETNGLVVRENRFTGRLQYLNGTEWAEWR